MALIVLFAASVGSIIITMNNTEETKALKNVVMNLNNEMVNAKLDHEKLNGYIELASNNRMASLISYHLNKGYSLKKLAANGYLNELSSAFKQDYIDDNVYTRMSALNNQVEFQNISSTEKLIREKWVAHIEEGSHFDLRPQGRLILSSESIDIPRCSGEKKPYLAYAIAYPVAEKNNTSTVDIKEEISLSGVQQYRFVLKKEDTLLPFDTAHRMLVDVGCINIEQDQVNDLTKEVAGMTN